MAQELEKKMHFDSFKIWECAIGDKGARIVRSSKFYSGGCDRENIFDIKVYEVDSVCQIAYLNR